MIKKILQLYMSKNLVGWMKTLQVGHGNDCEGDRQFICCADLAIWGCPGLASLGASLVAWGCILGAALVRLH